MLSTTSKWQNLIQNSCREGFHELSEHKAFQVSKTRVFHCFFRGPQNVSHNNVHCNLEQTTHIQLILSEVLGLFASTFTHCLQCRRPGVQSLSREDPLEKGMATHFTTVAWKIPWTEDLAGYSPWDCRVGHDCVINFPFLSFSFSHIQHVHSFTHPRSSL